MLTYNNEKTCTSSSEPKPYIPYIHLFLVVVLAFITMWLWLDTPKTDSITRTTTLATSPLQTPTPTVEEQTKPIDLNETSSDTIHTAQHEEKELPVAATQHKSNEIKVVIRQGDTLSALFDHYNLGQALLIHILSADESLLALETLKPGHVLFFRYKDDSQYLQEMELYIHAGHRIVYQRVAEDAFSYETNIQEGEWNNETISGTIEGSFYLSAQRAGLTEAETATVTQIFQDQLDFSRVIRKGDQFQIVRNKQFIDGEPTGQTRIDSARVQRRKYEHTAFLFQDGRYYDKEGNSLARAFTRTPLSKSYRISSHFNPRRVHPVTGRVRPHNGTDFATPTGTKVRSTGDGVVTRVGNHRFAGRYIDIKHGGHYKTRYLHLHRALVRKGQSVKRGQTIALSGNTGRSTGPHLHFELHINGRPVNPMKAKIPLSQSITKKDRSTFFAEVAKQTALLEAPQQLAKDKETKPKITKVALNKTDKND